MSGDDDVLLGRAELERVCREHGPAETNPVAVLLTLLQLRDVMVTPGAEVMDEDDFVLWWGVLRSVQGGIWLRMSPGGRKS